MKRGMGHGGAEGEASGLCNNKLLGGPINQTEIASVDGRTEQACACASQCADEEGKEGSGQSWFSHG